MKFNLEIAIEHTEPVSTNVSFPTTETMKETIKKIKQSSKHNREIVNQLGREFIAQLIEKYNSGEFDELGS